MTTINQKLMDAAWKLLHELEIVRDARAGEENWNRLNAADEALAAVLAEAEEAPQPVAEPPQGWTAMHVKTDTWEAFIDAMDRAERKGYLPDAVVSEWLAFDYMEAPAADPQSITKATGEQA